MVPNVLGKTATFILGAFFMLALIRAAHRAGMYQLVQLAIGQDEVIL